MSLDTSTSESESESASAQLYTHSSEVQKICRIKMIYIRVNNKIGELGELKDIANQLARMFYNQPNYDSCLGQAQNVHKKDKGFENKIFKVIWPERKILKVKCPNRKKMRPNEICRCSVCRPNAVSDNSAKQNNWKCTKIRTDIYNMINHIANHDIDIS